MMQWIASELTANLIQDVFNCHHMSVRHHHICICSLPNSTQLSLLSPIVAPCPIQSVVSAALITAFNAAVPHLRLCPVVQRIYANNVIAPV